MWKLLFVLPVAVAPLAAQSGVPEGLVRAEARADVQCLIQTRLVAGGVQLEGIVESQTPLSGTYRFDVRKTGPAGTSDSVQSGEFDVRAGQEVVGDVGLGLEPGASYDAKLVLRWTQGEAACSASGPDRA